MKDIIDRLLHTPSMAHQVASHSIDNTLVSPSRQGTAVFLRNLADDIDNGHYMVTTLSRGEHLSGNAPAAMTLTINLIPMHKPESPTNFGQNETGPFGIHR